jgi:hypothetical protein
MENSPTLELASDRPFGVGEVLSDTFGLMRDRAVTMFAVALLISLPTRLWLMMLPMATIQFNFTSDIAAGAFGGISTGLIAAVMLFFGQCALVRTALARSEGENVAFLRVLAPTLKRAPMLFAIALLATLGVFLGFICLLIPGIMLSLMWSVAGPVAAAENTGLVETFRRSRALTDNVLGEIFGLMLISGIGGGAFSWITRRLAESLLGVGASGLVYPFSPFPFLVGSLLYAIRMAFDLALVCSLYVALIRREGGGPMYQRLNRIFE